MNRTRVLVFIATIFVVAVVSIIAFANFGRGDGIETNKVYALAFTYKATIKGGGDARVFDFADRSLPRTSVVVPVRDDRGMPLIEEVDSLPPSTVRKVVATVPTRVVEDVTYPGYTYVVWQYHLSVKSEQSVVPTVTPRK